MNTNTEIKTLESAREAAYPTPDTPHTSVLMLVANSHVAFTKGWQARDAEIAELRAALEKQDDAAPVESDEDEWRRLALQFDGHRMQAIGLLKLLLSYAKSCEGMLNASPAGQVTQVEQFLSAPPLSGEDVLAQRIAALTQRVVSGAVPVGEKPFGYMIVGADGAIEFATKAHHEAQEHINDACEQGDVEGAGQWRAVPVHLNRPSNDQLWDQTLRERDGYHDVADRLAGAIAEYFGEDIGEHSSANCPWDEALRVVEEAPALAQHTGSEAVPVDSTCPTCSAPVSVSATKGGKAITISPDTAVIYAAQGYEISYATPPAAPVALSDEQIRVDLMRAATNCGHTIESEEITLFREQYKSGNALAQLADRLLEAYKVASQRPAAATQPTDADKRDAERYRFLCRNSGRIKFPLFWTKDSIDAAIAASAKEAK